jgi:hypothetical protein
MSQKKKKEELEKLFEEAQGIDGELSTDLIANPSDLVDVEEMYEHDYYADLEESIKESEEVVDSMARLYFNDNDDILNHPYLKKKREHDAMNHSDMMFLQKMAKKAIIKQLQQMDQGELSPRHFETFYNGLKEVRENIRQSTSTQSTMESFYKTIREDLGMTGNIGDSDTKKKSDGVNDGNLDLNSLDPQKLNEVLKDIQKKQQQKDNKNSEDEE